MNPEQLDALVRLGESETLELKRSTGQRTEAFKTLCAMLNGPEPGFVVFGVADDGQIVGQDVSVNTLEAVAAECRRIEPPAFPEVETIPVDARRSVLVVQVQGGSGVYTYDGRPYQRIGPTTSRMPQETYRTRLIELGHATNRWEALPAIGFDLADLNEEEIVRTVEEAIRRRQMQDPGSRDPLTLLSMLGLVEAGQLLNAAMVLFGAPEKLRLRYPQCMLRMARFRGVTKTEFIDNRQVLGNAFALFDAGQRFWIDHIPVAGRVVPDQIARIDEPAYPPEALREALVNALCHRDYSISGGAIEIAIFDDRLEISSAGGLHFGLTPESLTVEHRSRLWNPLIASVFYRRGIIEQWGRGTNQIIELMERAGLPLPEFEASFHEVVVRFRNSGPERRIVTNIPLTELQSEVLEILGRIGPVALNQIRAELTRDVPERTVQDSLQVLKTRGLARLSGVGVSARWSVS